MATNLSPTMRGAVRFMEHHGGLKRIPGGFWVAPDARTWANGQWFNTTTVQALVSRGVAEYTEWVDGQTRFPVRCALTAKSGVEG